MGISIKPSEQLDPIMEGAYQLAGVLAELAEACLERISVTRNGSESTFVTTHDEVGAKLHWILTRYDKAAREREKQVVAERREKELDTARTEAVAEYVRAHPETKPRIEGAPLRLHTLRDLLLTMNLPEPEPLIEPVLFKGETMLLGGQLKAGKTRLVQQMMLDVAAGKEVLGMPVARSLRVLSIDFESDPVWMKKRIKHMMGGDEAGMDSFQFWSALEDLREPWPDCSHDGIQRLLDLLNRALADVLVIDTWRHFLNGGDENDAGTIMRALKGLATIRETHPELAIIITHHTRKEQQKDTARRLLDNASMWVNNIAGHHALMAHVSTCYGFEAQSDGTYAFGGVARNHEPRMLLLRDNKELLRYEIVASARAAEVAMTPAERKIWRVARELGSFRFGELLDKAATKNKKAVSSALKTAADHHQLQHDNQLYTVVETTGDAE